MRERQSMIWKSGARMTRAAAILAATAASALVIVAPQASADAGELNGFVVASNFSTATIDGSLRLAGFTYNPNGSGSLSTDTFETVMQDGTNVGLANTGPGAYRIAFQGRNGDLWVSGPNYPSDHTITDTHLPMASGTSPSLAELPNGGFWIEFQHAVDGDLWSYSSFGSGQNAGPLAAGTSPVAFALADGSGPVLAWHDAATNDLTVSGPHGPIDTGMKMATGASPAGAGLNTGGYEIAFQCANFHLCLYGAAQTGDTGKVMVENFATTPSISSAPVGTFAPAGSFVVAYNSPSSSGADFLAIYGNYGGTIRALTSPYKEQGNTSPSVVGVLLPDGDGGDFSTYDIAFEQVPDCDPNCDQPSSLVDLAGINGPGNAQGRIDNLGYASGSSQPSLFTF